MAGHSKFKNIMHRKGAQDKKRAKVFTKLIRELTVAAKAGDDPQINPALRLAIMNSKAANMPKDTMERAIKKGAGGGDGADYEARRYEGYGPGGVAIIVEVLTDNKNRSVAEVRAPFSKYGGSLGETGSVAYMFKHVGVIRYQIENINGEDILDHAIEAGADDVESNEEAHEIICDVTNFHVVQQALSAKLGDPMEANLTWQPINQIEITDVEKARTLIKLVDALEDNDDVAQVCGNFTFSDNIIDQL